MRSRTAPKASELGVRRRRPLELGSPGASARAEYLERRQALRRYLLQDRRPWMRVLLACLILDPLSYGVLREVGLSVSFALATVITLTVGAILAHAAPVLKAGDDPKVRPWHLKAQACARTAQALRRLGPEWVVLHDRRIPRCGDHVLDHLAIGPQGIFAIASAWCSPGRGSGSLRRDLLQRLDTGWLVEVVEAVSAALARPPEWIGPPVEPVLCLSGLPLPSAETYLGGVTVVSPRRLPATLLLNSLAFSRGDLRALHNRAPLAVPGTITAVPAS